MLYNTHRPLRELHFPSVLGLRARKNFRSVVFLSRLSLMICFRNCAWGSAVPSPAEFMISEKKTRFWHWCPARLWIFSLETAPHSTTVRAAGSWDQSAAGWILRASRMLLRFCRRCPLRIFGTVFFRYCSTVIHYTGEDASSFAVHESGGWWLGLEAALTS